MKGEPMNDLISRQAAIDGVKRLSLGETDAMRLAMRIGDYLERLSSAQPDLDEWCTDCSEYDQERHCCPRWNRVIRQTLKDAQPERKTGEWIPCSERMPEEYSEYLVCYTTDDAVGLLWLDDTGESKAIVKKYNVLAWMSAPKPYKGEET